MILTVTLNPLLERRFVYESVRYGSNNRTSTEILRAGGKGINVSRQLNHLSIDNQAFTFAGGYSGKIFKKLLSEENIKASYVQTVDETRNASVVIDKQNSTISTFFGKNSDISRNESDEFLSRLEKMIANCEIVVFSGSSPSASADNIFVQGIKYANKMDKVSVLDTYGSHYLKCLDEAPTIVHNNYDELSSLYDISGETKILNLLDELYSKGIKQVFITNGSKDIYASNFDFHFRISPPVINTADPTGSGDAFTAGIIYGWHNNLTFEETAIIASCLGAVNASKYEICSSTLHEADYYRSGIQITPVGKKIKIIDDNPR